MPAIPFTDEERAAIEELSSRRTPDGRGLFLGGLHLSARRAIGELSVSQLSLERFHEAWTALAEVANQYDLDIIYNYSAARTVSDPAYIKVCKVPYQLGLSKDGDLPNRWTRYTPLECSCDGLSIEATRCNCNGASGDLLRCEFCGKSRIFAPGLRLREDSHGTVACDCAEVCTYEGCDRFTLDELAFRCEEHSGSAFGERLCNYCGARGYDGGSIEFMYDAADLCWCAMCWENRPRCYDCNRDTTEVVLHGRAGSYDEYDEYDSWICVDCEAAERALIAERITSDPLVPGTPDALAVAALADRPPRAISVEQEMTISGKDGEILANALYEAGLSPFEFIEGYHSSGHAGFAHIETDSSIAGYELIWNRVDFSLEQEQLNAAKVVEAVRASGASFDATCGTHFHVDMHGLDVRDAKNLVIVYSYLEDPIYRIAAAGYEEHRSKLRQGRVYARSIQKQEWRDVRHFGREFLRTAQHDDSLNLQHYYQSMRHCECGAIEFGSQKECDCNLGKLTAEWRVFNGTNDPRKLRAWLALAQACTAYAQDREIRYADFRPLSYGQDHDRATAEERLRWLLTALPMTESEKADVVWCLQNTALAHEFTDGELEGFVGEYEPERQLPPAPEHGFRSSVPPRGTRSTPQDHQERQDRLARAFDAGIELDRTRTNTTSAYIVEDDREEF